MEQMATMDMEIEFEEDKLGCKCFWVGSIS